MSEAKDSNLKIKVTGEAVDSIPADAFIELFEDTLAILRDIDAEISQSENGVLDWEIVQASLNSPMELTVRSRADIGINIGSEVISAYLNGVADLERGERFIPEHFSRPTLERAKKLGYVFNRGISSISFSRNGENPVQATRRIVENTANVLDMNLPVDDEVLTQHVELHAIRQPNLEEKATIVGRLEAVSVHGSPSFTLYDPLLKNKIDCFFDEKEFTEIQSYLSPTPNRVEVTGTAKYNKYGNPVSIKVDEYRRLEDQSKLPQFRDLEGINLSGELDPTEYIRRLRSE